MKKFLAILAMAAALPAAALEVGGVKLDDKAKVGPSELVLNGAGIRKRVVVNVYVGALYLPEKKANGNDAVAAAGAKRVSLHMLRDLTGQQFADALKESIKLNTSEADLGKLAAELNDFNTTLNGLGPMKSGETFIVDWVPGTGLILNAAGKPVGKPIASADFMRALLRVWLGDNPVDAGLKKGMLGG